MRHLDERISDLVDDRLEHDERDRALVHLTECATCRDAVESERHARNALRSLPDTEPSEQLVQNLLALAEPGEPLPPEPPQGTGLSAPVANWRPRGSRPPAGPADGRPGPQRRTSRRTRTVRVAALGMCTTGAMLVVFAALGGQSGTTEPPATPASVVPPMEDFTFEHARSTGGLPFVESASLLVGNVGNTGSTGAGW
ncbi:hypothetical protein CLV30_112108 [Haloactinopolyspora alba]|uniref:Uncharacterized protein n=1 Tax=Haloactinopolyspora alba TaxID=648780 RepID=A0A2P8DXB9_9ACTN|nr:zf-HC2 domain-containing protein [Haloactinopolyspora alba]PSL01869.1 hypothetical protein CLV30_112108 [Haloactinopolyspora alba]